MKPTNDQIKIAGLYLQSISPARDKNAEYSLNTILAALAAAQHDLAATIKAKQENDERFMLERDEARNALRKSP